MGALVTIFVLIVVMPGVFMAILPVVILAYMIGGQNAAGRIINSSLNLARDLGNAVGNTIVQFLGLVHHTFYSRWPMTTVIAYVIGIITFVVFMSLR